MALKITKITNKIRVITGKYDTVVETPFGRFTAENHEDGIREAKAYVARFADPR